ncbi:hypothetical protein [Pseudonocardia sp. ICBG1293]|uniref:hypothetical protein n=1 Tax=Pseudonocardia sp. ICBG1293 TaxID=2844382 RepID=UPI001CCB233A|nr:hypothetical protein [Pseudonocardia sp. ICBG1293]
MTDTPGRAPLPGAPGATGRRDVVSVAELLARHSRASHASSDGTGPLTGPVLSVGDLLRREGRPPVAEGASAEAASAGDIAAAGAPGGWPDIDLPQPRTAEGAEGWAGRQGSGRRRAGAVAGALLAAGSVLGAALYNGVGTENSDARAAADGLFPGFGLPTAGTPDTLPAQYLPANVALSSPLPDVPATAPGATDWMAVAFGPRQPAQAVAAGVAPGTATGPTVPAPRTPATPPSTGDPGTGSPSVPAPRGPGGTGSPLAPIVAPINNPDRPPAGNLLEPVTGTPPSRGGTSTGPIQDVTENVRPVGDAVGGVVGGVVAPVAQVAAPVGRTLGGAVSPVTEAVRPVTDAVKPVTRPLTDTLEPVTTPVLGALSPVTEPVLKGTEPLTGPVLKAAEPVTGLLDTSAKKATGNTGSSSSEATQPLQAVTEPVGQVVGTVTEPVGAALSGVTEPVGGVLGGVTKSAGGLLGG